jgi:hypothetical protein
MLETLKFSRPDEHFEHSSARARARETVHLDIENDNLGEFMPL